MTQPNDSQNDYQAALRLTQAERRQQIEDAATSTDMRAILLCQEGQQLADERQFEAAIASYEQAIQANPDYLPALKGKASLLNALERYHEAFKAYAAAIEQDPNDYSLWRDRGAVLFQLKQRAEGLASLEKALELNPNAVEVWSLKALELARSQQRAEALESCDRAIAVDPKEHSAWRLRGLLFKENQPDEALKNYDQALELNPDDAELWVYKAKALSGLGREEEAVISYDRALDLKPREFYLWYQRGLSLRRLGQFDSAIASFDQTLSLNPYCYPASRSRLYALLTTGKLVSHAMGNCSVAEQKRLWHDLNQALAMFSKRKLPALVVVGLVALFSTHSQAIALLVASLFAGIAVWGDLIQEAEK